MADIALFEAYMAIREPSFLEAYTTESIAAALIRGEDHISNRYEPYLIAGYTMAHERVQRAVYEATRLELKEPGFFNQHFTTKSAKVLTRAGDLEWERSGMERMEPLVLSIRDIMEPITTEKSTSYHAIRAIGR